MQNKTDYSASPSCGHWNESCKLECVVTCVGFDDILDVSLTHNHGHVDHLIVVTSHEDKATQEIARKHSVTLVVTDLFGKNGRNFNKGAAINAGFDMFQWAGWRMHLDVDILLPDNFRRVLFNHSHLEADCIYGADRISLVGNEELMEWEKGRGRMPQLVHGYRVTPQAPHEIGSRYIDGLRGYCPLGYFQLWHADRHKAYPFSLGSAAHDDVIFSGLWPHHKRRLLPGTLVYHLCTPGGYCSQNWNGRKSPRLPKRK